MRVVFDQKQSRWRWLAGLLLAVLCVGGLMDYAVRHLLWRAALQPAVQAAYAFSVAWDDFWEMAARQVTFQRTFPVCVDLLDPRKRLSLWRSVANWADEMRRCADADAWVLTDSKGAIVALTPSTVALSSWRPVWRQPFLSLPCTFAVVSSGETLLAGVGAPVLENGRPRGELWLLYRLHRVAGKMPASSGFRWRLVAGKYVLAAGGDAEGERHAPFVFPLEAVPLRLDVWVPTALLPMGWVQVLIWASLFLLLVLAAILAEHAQKRTPERLPLVVLEACHALSEQLLRSRDASKVFQALADAVVTWLNLPVAVVLKLDMEKGVARVLGFAPRNLVTQLALRYFGIDPTQFTVPFDVDVPAFKAALQGAPYISANPSDFLGDLFPPHKVALVQRLLRVKLGWGAILFAEGKPIGSLLTATPHNAFSDEELQALELIRQQAAVLLALAEQWEAQEQAHRRVTHFQNTLLRLTKEVSFKGDLTEQLTHIAQVARDALQVSRLNIWQQTLDGHFHCVGAAGDEAAQLLGTILPAERFSAYIASLEAERVIATSSVADDPRTRELLADYWQPHGIVATMDAAIRVEGKVVGIVCCEHKTPRDWTGDEMAFAGDIADLVARVFLENQHRRRERYLATLSQLALQLSVAPDWQGVLPVFLEDLGKVAGSDCAFLAQLVTDENGSEGLKCVSVWSADGSAAEEEGICWLHQVGTPEQVTALRRGEAVTFLTQSLPEPYRQFYEAKGVKAVLAAPVFAERQWWGILGSSIRRTDRTWDEVDTAIFKLAASFLGSAMERQKSIERQLKQEQQFQELVENAPVGIYRSTPDGRFLMANETLARINGYESVDELMALDIPSQIYLNPEDRERFKRLMEVHGYVANYRFPFKRKDGSIGWVAEWARAVKDETGKVRYYEGFVLDITEQVWLEERLRSLQETARTLVMRLDLDSILQVVVTEFLRLYPDAAVLVFCHQSDDVPFTLERASENAHDLLRALHLNLGQSLKHNAFAALHERLLAGEHIVVNDLSTGVGSVFRELTKLGYQSLYLRGVGESSQLCGVIAVFRKGATFSEVDLTFLNSFCDYLSIAVRNALLFVQVQKAYDELRAVQEQIMEQQRLRALGQIASGIAHDINNALMPIQGFAEILLEYNDPFVRNAAETIFKSATDIAKIVQRMREFYRPRNGEEVLEPVDLNAICKDALEMSRPRWFNMPQERGIVIETRLELADDLPPLSGVPSEIRQAIINLILNAVDAMPEGGILTIRTERQERGGRAWAVVEVSDTGVGMDEETRRRAFEPFFTTKPHGSGLGLAAVYRTVQRHEGFVEIDSEVGKGTTVRLWFPSNLVLPQALPEGEVPSLRVLVIDDEPSVREILALLLYRDGHLVTTATNGEEGVMLFQNAQWQGKAFDVVITDLGMPKVDGLWVVQKVKSLAPETPVILLTGWGFRIRSEDVQRIVDVVLTKPVTHQQLRRALSRVWSKRLEKAN